MDGRITLGGAGKTMDGLQEAFLAYKKQMELGAVQRAYRGVMDFMMGLRTDLEKKYPEHNVSRSPYFGYMDMTYFAFTSKALNDQQLKIAIVFVHDSCRFEVWLAAKNKKVQGKYWEMLRESGWDQYPIVKTIKGVDAILEQVLVEKPDFSDREALSQQIESGTLKFSGDVEAFLAAQ